MTGIGLIVLMCKQNFSKKNIVYIILFYIFLPEMAPGSSNLTSEWVRDRVRLDSLLEFDPIDEGAFGGEDENIAILALTLLAIERRNTKLV